MVRAHHMILFLLLIGLLILLYCYWSFKSCSYKSFTTVVAVACERGRLCYCFCSYLIQEGLILVLVLVLLLVLILIPHVPYNVSNINLGGLIITITAHSLTFVGYYTFSHNDLVSTSDLNVSGTNNDTASNTFRVCRFCFFRQDDSRLFLLLICLLVHCYCYYYISNEEGIAFTSATLCSQDK